MIGKAYAEVDELIKQYHAGTLESLPGMSVEKSLESMIQVPECTPSPIISHHLVRLFRVDRIRFGFSARSTSALNMLNIPGITESQF